jgi:hypothetical protein
MSRRGARQADSGETDAEGQNNAFHAAPLECWAIQEMSEIDSSACAWLQAVLLLETIAK